MTDEKKIDYGNVPITKLPPGKAFGADDLTKWSLNRTAGHYGTGDNRAKSVVLKCEGCGRETSHIIAVYAKAKRLRKEHCECGAKMQPILFRREGFKYPDSPKTVMIGKQTKKKRKGSRADGTNPRALGTNERAKP